jgi:predicted dehydrogenase
MGIKTAVIGVGSMGRNHARLFSELANVDFVAVSDASQEVAANIAHKYSVQAYTNYEELLEKERPEAVSIAVPTAMHNEVASKAMQAGAHVLIEKPIASTVEDGRALITESEELGKKLMVGHIVRFNPAIRALKEKLDDGDLGKVIQILCRRIGPFPARIRDVGVVVDLAPHDIDVMRYLTDESPERVYAEIEQHVHTEYEDLVFGLLHFPSGVTGALEINWLTPTKVRETLVLGELGMFRVNDLTQDLYFYENAETNKEIWPTLGHIKGVSEGKMVRYPVNRYEPLRAELEAFIKSIEEDTPVPISGEDGLEALRLAQALIKSGTSHEVVRV